MFSINYKVISSQFVPKHKHLNRKKVCKNNTNLKVFSKNENSLLNFKHENKKKHRHKRIVNLKDGIIIDDSLVDQVRVKSLENV